MSFVLAPRFVRSRRLTDLSCSPQSFLGSTLSGLGGKPQGGSHGGGGVGGLAGSVVTGLLSSGHGGGHGGGHSSGGGLGGKLASQLASNLFSSGSKPASASPQNYHGSQSSGHGAGGGLGGLVGGVASMFGGKPHGSVGLFNPRRIAKASNANNKAGRPEQFRLLQQRTIRLLQRSASTCLVPTALAARPVDR